MVEVSDLEVDAVEHCNLKCAHCSHLSPYFKINKDYTLSKFKNDINILSKILKTDIFRFVGGEPFLNLELDKMVKHVRESNIAKKISIFTNGLVLDKISLSTLMLFDDIRISVYNLEKDKFNKILDNVEIIKEKLKDTKTLVVENHIKTFLKFNLIEKNEDKNLVKKIFDNCYHKKDSYSIYMGRLYRCFATRKKHIFLNKFKSIVKGNFSKMLESSTDSIKIDNSLSEQKLNAFLFSNVPLEGCKWCLGCSGKRIKNGQLGIDYENDFATLSDINFEEGKSYVSNCLKSWHREREEILIKDKFFDKKYDKDFNTFHSLKPSKI